MGLFKKNDTNQTKCPKCGLELHDPERLKRHISKAHAHVNTSKKSEEGGGGLW